MKNQTPATAPNFALGQAVTIQTVECVSWQPITVTSTVIKVYAPTKSITEFRYKVANPNNALVNFCEQRYRRESELTAAPSLPAGYTLGEILEPTAGAVAEIYRRAGL